MPLTDPRIAAKHGREPVKATSTPKKPIQLLAQSQLPPTGDLLPHMFTNDCAPTHVRQ